MQIGRRGLGTLVGGCLSASPGCATGNGVPASTRLRSSLWSDLPMTSPRLPADGSLLIQGGLVTGNGVPASTRPRPNLAASLRPWRGASTRTSLTSSPLRPPPQPSFGGAGALILVSSQSTRLFTSLVPCSTTIVVVVKVPRIIVVPRVSVTLLLPPARARTVVTRTKCTWASESFLGVAVIFAGS